MSSATIGCAAVHGGKVIPIRVEVDIQPGIPLFTIIGLPDKRIEEAKERVRSAIKNSSFTFPRGRITVNLSPSGLRKQGTGFDLAIGLGLLVASGLCPKPPESIWIIGEVALTGEIRAHQELPAILVEAVRRNTSVLISKDYHVTGLGKGLLLSTIGSLRDLPGRPWEKLESLGDTVPKPLKPASFLLDSVMGQSMAKRALEIALAGSHRLLLTGPAGNGKSMVAHACHELLPAPTIQEAMGILTVSALSDGSRDEQERPYRAPHHSVSGPGMLGGVRPGELALAHGGTLFLDELTLFKRSVLDSLREPFQERRLSLKRGGVTYEYEADPFVVAACNSCPCGLLGSDSRECRCTAKELMAYEKKLSGPLLDRFSMYMDLPDISIGDMGDTHSYLPGAAMAKRILESRNRQYKRNGKGRLNGVLKNNELKVILEYGECRKALDKAAGVYGLSGRGIESTLAVARTITDLDGKEAVGVECITEALLYRRKGMGRG